MNTLIVTMLTINLTIPYTGETVPYMCQMKVPNEKVQMVAVTEELPNCKAVAAYFKIAAPGTADVKTVYVLDGEVQ